MAKSGMPSSLTWSSGEEPGGRERGGRRKKVYEYLRAANELRQTYAAQWTTQRNAQRDYDDEYFSNAPPAFSDVVIARSTDAEMVLFPTYARKIVPRNKRPSDAAQQYRSYPEQLARRERAEVIGLDRGEWADLEDENTVVDADVRGWVYSPQRGSIARKHRLMIALARKLSGIPSPTSVPMEGRDESTGGKSGGNGDDELIEKEAQKIIGTSEKEADADWSSPSLTGSISTPSTGRFARWTMTQPSPMSKDEISIANAHLMERLRPFLNNPLPQMPVTVFFFNDETSQSRSIMTDESGHFSLRAALPFVPTHIRVLAAEDLAAAKEIKILEPSGVSLISDIDDTVKHSAIASGAREIFRNTFVKELSDLTINGVTEWYQKLAEMGVAIHYVSNSPWQLYPLLERYFRLARLPPGSFHLKQYSGMLQGIFEPSAEKKRASLEQILRDFPERKFILVGDSGEADLEAYTEVVEANPSRILAVFIRDVTTSEQRKFFEKSVEHVDIVSARSHSSAGRLEDLSDTAENRPSLPPRRPPQTLTSNTEVTTLDNADLIELSDDEDMVHHPSTSDQIEPRLRQPPPKPPKRPSLRSVPKNSDLSDNKERTKLDIQDVIRRKPVPPIPSRRSSGSEPHRPPVRDLATAENPLTPFNASNDLARGKKGSEGQNGGYIQTMQNAISSVSNVLPSSTDSLPVCQKLPGLSSNSRRLDGSDSPRSKQPPPAPPPRRSNTRTSVSSLGFTSTSSRASGPKSSYPVAAAASSVPLHPPPERRTWSPSPANSAKSSASNLGLTRTNTFNSTSSDQDSPLEYSGAEMGIPSAPLPNKREELWRRRWERAKNILESHGVLLGSWRVGSDVQDVCVWLVQEALKDIQNRADGARGSK